MSVKKLDGGLYYMEYKGDDGFAGLIENGGGRSAAEHLAAGLHLSSYPGRVVTNARDFRL